MATPRHRFPDRATAEPHAYLLVGPTATGKSAVAQALAEHHALGILSADSMLVYRGMDIGTAKPTREERGGVPYWGIDLVSPEEPFSAGAYLRHAAEAHRAARARDLPLVVTGGTGLYVTGLLQGLNVSREPAPEIRAQVQAWYAEAGRDGLGERLRRLAPDRYQALDDPMNPRRLMRALELHLEGVAPPAGWQDPPAPLVVGLRMERSALARRIDERVQRMYRDGLLDEAERIRSDTAGISVTAREAIGYAEAFAVLDGTMSRNQAMERTAIRTRQLAKRQMTWFRKKLNLSWVDVAPGQDVQDLAQAVRLEWERTGPCPIRVETADENG